MLGDPKASFTKEEMHQGLHQIYEKKLHNQLIQQDTPNSISISNTTSSTSNKTTTKDTSPSNSECRLIFSFFFILFSIKIIFSSILGTGQNTFIPSTVVTSSSINIVNSK